MHFLLYFIEIYSHSIRLKSLVIVFEELLSCEIWKNYFGQILCDPGFELGLDLLLTAEDELEKTLVEMAGVVLGHF